MNTQQYAYLGTIIKIRYYQPDPYEVGGYHWEVYKNGSKLSDSSKQYSEDTVEQALFRAKQAADFHLDTDSDKQPVLLMSD